MCEIYQQLNGTRFAERENLKLPAFSGSMFQQTEMIKRELTTQDILYVYQSPDQST